MPTRLVARRIYPRDIRQYDHITFDYGNPHDHAPTRVGEVIGFTGNPNENNYCVLLWDYSLWDGPNPRNYRTNLLRGLSRLEEIEIDSGSDPLNKFKEALKRFRKMFGRGSGYQNSSDAN